MADTRIQHKVERWIVENELSRLYGRPFTKRKAPLSWGGSFEFDAVSADSLMIVSVSTSACRTASGKNAIGKFHKIKADALYLLHAVGVERRVLAFTDPGMLAHFERERDRGRFPPTTAIELLPVTLPADLMSELCAATKVASLEVTRTETDS